MYVFGGRRDHLIFLLPAYKLLAIELEICRSQRLLIAISMDPDLIFHCSSYGWIRLFPVPDKLEM